MIRILSREARWHLSLSHTVFVKASSSRQRQQSRSHLRDRHCRILCVPRNLEIKNIFHKHCISYTAQTGCAITCRGAPEDSAAPPLTILCHQLPTSSKEPVEKTGIYHVQACCRYFWARHRDIAGLWLAPRSPKGLRDQSVPRSYLSNTIAWAVWTPPFFAGARAVHRPLSIFVSCTSAALHLGRQQSWGCRQLLLSACPCRGLWGQSTVWKSLEQEITKHDTPSFPSQFSKQWRQCICYKQIQSGPYTLVHIYQSRTQPLF